MLEQRSSSVIADQPFRALDRSLPIRERAMKPLRQMDQYRTSAIRSPVSLLPNEESRRALIAVRHKAVRPVRDRAPISLGPNPAAPRRRLCQGHRALAPPWYFGSLREAETPAWYPCRPSDPPLLRSRPSLSPRVPSPPCQTLHRAT